MLLLLQMHMRECSTLHAKHGINTWQCQTACVRAWTRWWHGCLFWLVIDRHTAQHVKSIVRGHAETTHWHPILACAKDMQLFLGWAQLQHLVNACKLSPVELAAAAKPAIVSAILA